MAQHPARKRGQEQLKVDRLNHALPYQMSLWAASLQLVR